MGSSRSNSCVQENSAQELGESSGSHKVAPWWTSQRFLLVVIAAIGYIHVYALRGNLSVAVLCMDGEFVWDKEKQGLILGAYYYGYIASQVPSGILAERFGGKWVFAGFMTTATVATIFTPLAARIGFGFLFVLRIIVGFGTGGSFPVTQAMWARWAPPTERSRFAAVSSSGAIMGNVVVMALGGVLCEHGFDGGWPSIFYVWGGCAALWLVVWLLVAHDTPEDSSRISREELCYIKQSQQGQISTADKKSYRIPWVKMMTSPAVWSIIVVNFAADWGLYTFLTNIPTYMYEVLKFDIESNGLFSALPFLGQWLCLNIAPTMIEKSEKSSVLSKTTTRKLTVCLGMLVPAFVLIGLSFIDCLHAGWAVFLLTLGVSISGVGLLGYSVNAIDIAPPYAGTVYGISNTLACTSGFIVPYFVAVTTKEQTQEEWQVVFVLAAAMYSGGALFYCLFGTAEIQDWALSKANRILSERTSLIRDSDFEDSTKYESTKIEV